MVKFKVNGSDREFAGDPSMPLLWYLRDEAGLTGTKYGCGMSLCGACTVHLNGKAVRSCVMPVSAVAGKKVETIEALAEDRVGKAVQSSWRELDVVQCGYCQSGQIMSAAALLRDKSNPTDADINASMNGNLCRCGTYQRIRAAIHHASASLNG